MRSTGASTALLVFLVMSSLAGCGGARSYWLATETTPETAPADRGCWDACRTRWNDGTMELGKCVAKCPGVEKRDVSCPEAERERCVADTGSAITIILIGGAVALALVIAAALLL